MKTHVPVENTVKAKEALGPFLSTASLFFSPFLSLYPSRIIYLLCWPFAKLTETMSTCHSVTGMKLVLMARALGPSEKRGEALSCLLRILRARRPSCKRSLLPA